MIRLYSFLYFFALILYFPVFFIRFRLLKKETINLKERFTLSLPSPAEDRPCLWIHAVSVGEVLSLQSLLACLKKRHPSWRIVLTSLTPSGVRLAREKMALLADIAFLPLDLPWCLRRFFRRLQPSVLALTESEFWPNLLSVAREEAVPVVLINGRISARSFQRFRKFRTAVCRLLEAIDFFLVQTETDRERLLQIGLSPEKIILTGNLKCDVSLPSMDSEEVSRWKKGLGLAPEAKIITAGSTRRGEEFLLLEALVEARKERPCLHLILAPRHPERWEEVAEHCRNLSLSWQRWSFLRNGEAGRVKLHERWDVLIVDTIGELPRFYGLADLAFVGGSLVPWGGHNILEPAFYGKPILFGPHMDNFAHLAQKFLQAEAARLVKGKEDLIQAFLCLGDPSLERMGERAKCLLQSLQGATEKTVSILENLVGKMSQEAITAHPQTTRTGQKEC